MDAETLEALKGSIAKWEGVVDGSGKERGASNCPLCQKFNKEELDEPYDEDADGESACDGCPVRAKTGLDWCEGTPYTDLLAWSGDGDGERLHKPGSESYRKIAQAELDFLKSLLPVTP